MALLSSCAFCNREELKCQLIYEDSVWRIIFARRPLTTGHIMIMPQNHFSNFAELGLRELETIGKVVQKASKILSIAFQATGTNVFANIGKSAGQSVPHLHLHIITRFDNELRNPFQILNSSKEYKNLPLLTPEELAERVSQLKNQFENVG